MVIDRAGLQVVLGHPKVLLDVPQLMICIEDERRGHAYNTTRLHSSLGYLSPAGCENRYRDTVTSIPEVA